MRLYIKSLQSQPRIRCIEIREQDSTARPNKTYYHAKASLFTRSMDRTHQDTRCNPLRWMLRQAREDPPSHADCTIYFPGRGDDACPSVPSCVCRLCSRVTHIAEATQSFREHGACLESSHPSATQHHLDLATFAPAGYNPWRTPSPPPPPTPTTAPLDPLFAPPYFHSRQCVLDFSFESSHEHPTPCLNPRHNPPLEAARQAALVDSHSFRGSTRNKRRIPRLPDTPKHDSELSTPIFRTTRLRDRGRG